MTNYGLQVTLSLGWNGNPLYDINGELVQPTDRNVRERTRALDPSEVNIAFALVTNVSDGLEKGLGLGDNF